MSMKFDVLPYKTRKVTIQNSEFLSKSNLIPLKKEKFCWISVFIISEVNLKKIRISIFPSERKLSNFIIFFRNLRISEEI